MKLLRKISVILLVFAAALCLASCGKTTVRITLTQPSEFEITRTPEDFESLGVDDNEIDLTVKKDGDYSLTVQDTAGKTYEITVSVSGSIVTADLGDAEGAVGVD